MKKLIFVIFTIFATQFTFGATFKSARHLSYSTLEDLASVVRTIQSNQSAFGDASTVLRYRFTRNESEQNYNTVKQANIAKARLWEDDVLEVADGKTAEQLADHLLENANPDTDDSVLEEANAQLLGALRKALDLKTVSVFSSKHADEDGSYNVVDLVDNRNGELLIIKFGYVGT